MVPGGRKQEPNESRMLAQTALALLLLALGLMIWDQDGQRIGRTPRRIADSPYNRETIASINRHLQSTEQQTSLGSMAVAVENAKMAPAASKAPPPVVWQPQVSPFETEDTAGQVFKDIEPESGKFIRPSLPEDRVGAMLEQRQWVEQYNRQQREQFVQAVKNSARADGFDLQINKDLQITRVRRIPNSAMTDGKPGGAR
jgi:hypothetical protein